MIAEQFILKKVLTIQRCCNWCIRYDSRCRFEWWIQTTTQAFSFGHGSYTNAKQIQQYSTEQKLALTLKINYSMFSMDQNSFIKNSYIVSFLRLVSYGQLKIVE